jgi:chemotaxis protein MotB
MRKTLGLVAQCALIVIMATGLTGCTVIFQKGRRSDIEKITKLKNELSELERAKAELEDRLKGEKNVKVEMSDRGLVITFLAEVLFDSGKDKIRTEAKGKLDQVADVLQTTVRDLNVGIEGHTDNQPIKRSGWKSNWELSSARALAVLHYMEDSHGIDPARLSAIGYGEYHPVDTNDTREGRQRNRRVEIVIIPKVEKDKSGKVTLPE